MPNQLQYETSPYLLQHAENPVNWYPWGEEAFRRAREEDKPVFLSIGYSTCHWCHVMAHESFEDEEIAGLLNRYFISIKVDNWKRGLAYQYFHDSGTETLFSGNLFSKEKPGRNDWAAGTAFGCP